MDEQKNKLEIDKQLDSIVRRAADYGNGSIPSIVEEKVQSAYASIRSDLVQEGKEETQKAVKKKRHTRRNLAISLASMAAAFLIFFGVGAANPAWATQIPIIGGLFAFFQENSKKETYDFDTRYFQGDLNSTAQQVLASAQNDGVTITIEEASFDGLSLVLSLRATTNDPRFQEYTLLTENPETYDSPTIKFGNQETVRTEYADGRLSDAPHKIKPTSSVILTKQTDGSFTGALTFNMSTYTEQFNLELPQSGESIACTLTIPQLAASKTVSNTDNSPDYLALPSTWSIPFPVRLDTSKNQTLEINQKVNDCILKTIERTPSSTRVTILVPKKKVASGDAISFPYTETYDAKDQKLYVDISKSIREAFQYVSLDHSKMDDMGPDDYVTSVHITPYCPPGRKKIVFQIHDTPLAVFQVDIPE